jgi:integrase
MILSVNVSAGKFPSLKRKQVIIKLSSLAKKIIRSLTYYMPHAAPGKFLFENERTGQAINRIQAYRIIRGAAEALNFNERISCHSLRKTFGYHSWKNGVSPAVIFIYKKSHSFFQ